MSKNEMVGKPAMFGANVEKPAVKAKINGRELLPNFAASGNGAVQNRYKFWIGVTPNCPVDSIDCAGINFPKINEILMPDPMRTGLTRRVPVIGAIVELSEEKIRLLRERLPQIVMRITSDTGEKDEDGTGQNIGDVHRRPARGQLITIPTKEEIETRQKNGKPSRAYVRQPNDFPAVHYMFMALCADQQKGNRGEVYPDTLETTGIEWPDEIEGVEVATQASPKAQKTAQIPQEVLVSEDYIVPPIAPKKPRGRPRKNPVAEPQITQDSTES